MASWFSSLKKGAGASADAEVLKEIARHLEKISKRLEEAPREGQTPWAGIDSKDLQSLQDFARAVHDQKAQSNEILKKVETLPTLVDKIGTSLESLEEFHETLREISAAMNALSRNQLEAYRDTAAAFDRQTQKALESLEETQRETVRGLRRAQEDQFEKLDAVLETTRAASRLTLWILFLFLVALGFVLFVQWQLFEKVR